MILSAILVCGSVSCVSLEHAFDPETDFEIYGGVKSSWAYMSNPDSDFWGTLFRFIDFPLTAVMDTLLLPVSIPVATSR